MSEAGEAWEARRTSFGAAADLYAASRAPYPLDAVAWAVGDAAHVLDLGAGTGRLTEALLALGRQVTAVEPDDAMRAHVPAAATVLAGTAEAVPLPDASVDAVVVGQAWHWFDAVRALAECRRVLRPGGTVAVVNNLWDDSVGWVAALTALWPAEDRASVVFDEPELPGTEEERRFAHRQPATPDLLVDNVSSRSGVILLPAAEREQLLARVRALAPGPTFDIPWVTVVARTTG